MENLGLYLTPPKMRGDAANYVPTQESYNYDSAKSFLQMSFSELKDFLNGQDYYTRNTTKSRESHRKKKNEAKTKTI